MRVYCVLTVGLIPNLRARWNWLQFESKGHLRIRHKLYYITRVVIVGMAVVQKLFMKVWKPEIT